MLARLLKICCLIALPFLAWGYGREAWHLIARVSVHSSRWQAFGIGFGLFVPVWLLFRERLTFLLTMEHELTHLIVGLLFLKKPYAFQATAHQGGAVWLGGHNFLIGLAPYFLPTISFLLLPFSLVLQRNYVPPFLVILGFSVAYHVLSTFQELHFQQTDLKQAGWIFCLLFLPVANLICYGMIVAFVNGGFDECGQFCVGGIKEGLRLVARRPLV